ncbi:UTRA domain-containing protein [Pseudooceanicola aestuarii]|uniref:UTRA domain-containing protein n=1 Tax=Pseudooceanicola aestuarii TaxID=2697319 RepID=UPI0013D33A0B|nr:UTRA domain-containing protein [Pseudooceanicola aestuarii]
MPPRSTETLHARILDDITRKIVDGTWKPGHRLDREIALAEHYGVSRMTMNKVLTRLAQDGYIVRRKRTGTHVAQPRAQSAVLAINHIAEEVAGLGRAYRWILLSSALRASRADDRRILGLEEAESPRPALFLSGLHLADAAPFCLETRAINPDTVPDAAQTDFGQEAPGTWLLNTMPWTNARHQVRAVGAPDHDAARLDLKPGTPCLEILRKTRIDADWVTCVRLLYPGAAHQLVAEFDGGAGPAAGPGAGAGS